MESNSSRVRLSVVLPAKPIPAETGPGPDDWERIRMKPGPAGHLKPALGHEKPGDVQLNPCQDGSGVIRCVCNAASRQIP